MALRVYSYVLYRDGKPGIGPFNTTHMLDSWAQAKGIQDYRVLVVERPSRVSPLTVIEGGQDSPTAA